MDNWVGIRWINLLVVLQRITKEKQIKITVENELTSIPTTLMKRLGHENKGIIV
jgi:hypothetical protein